jgi:hypothetical protein
MNLPHLNPVLFAKEVLKKEENTAEVLCEFPYLPTLPMFLEAAAQASSVFSQKEEGFLVGASDVKLHKKTKDLKVLIRIVKEISMGEMKIFSFEIKDICAGKFSIYVK